ncbi:GntR family transcriptional regulator [Aestuariivirga sp.]|uniref:GntR family transcriptional regulator n=1 Tax=Aestuariivirga sp. TaxID=2650926 RepID=UPI003BAB3A2A
MGIPATEDAVVRLLDRRLPAADQIYGHLREEIITCRLGPNEALSENRICGMFGVSRSPVRIALTRLAEDGLIDIFPQRGSFVAPIRMKQVKESQFARTALEMALVKVAAQKWSTADAAEAHVNLADQKRHAMAGDAWGFYLDNERFHQLIARAADLEGVWKTVQGVKMLWDRIGHLANRVPGHREDIIAEHEAIVAALDQGDSVAAVKAMKLHLRSVFNAIARLRPLHEDYFTDT